MWADGPRCNAPLPWKKAMTRVAHSMSVVRRSRIIRIYAFIRKNEKPPPVIVTPIILPNSASANRILRVGE